MQNVMRKKMGVGFTVHGFRSSFMDWVAEVHPQRSWRPSERWTTRSAPRCSGRICGPTSLSSAGNWLNDGVHS